MMKRFLALVLVLTLGLSLTGCVQEERYPEIADLLDAGAYEDAMLAIYDLYLQDHTTDPTADPDLERKYRTLSSAVDALSEYVENQYDLNSFSFVYFDGYAHIPYEGMDAVAWLYRTALELGNYRNAAQIASRFTVLEDVAMEKVYRYADALGNITESSRVYYVYSANGDLVSQSPDIGTVGDRYRYNHGTPEYTSDENGTVTSVRYLSGDTVNCVIDYTYNPDGTLATEHYLDKDGSEYTVTYFYGNGLPVRAEGVPYAEGSAETMTVEYHYDEYGRLILETGISDSWDESSASQFIKTVHYTYDENGRCVSIRKATEYRIKEHFEDADRSLKQYQDVREWTFSYDADGRLLRNTYAVIGTADPNGTPLNGSYRIYTGETSYGSYYVYTPASTPVR